MTRSAALLAALFLIAGCVTGSPSPVAPGGSGEPTGTLPASTATAQPTPGPTARLLSGQPMTPCLSEGRLAQCGTLVVPEDRSSPDGRTIALKVVLIPALATTAAPDPVFMLAGGPGGAATISMAWTANLFGAIHATRDIVLVDQRGTGGSNQLWLANPPDLTGRSDAEIRTAIGRWATNAFAALDADASTYTTAVRDGRSR